MSAEKSIARRKEMGDDYRVPKHFIWFGKDLAEFFDTVQRIGAENVVIEEYFGADEDGTPRAFLRVTDVRDKSKSQFFNYSHPCCPWQCPPDYMDC